MPTVWMYVDPFSTMTDEDRATEMGLKDGTEVEYQDLEKLLRKEMPDHNFLFKRGVLFVGLQNSAPDLYIFDIGGMCATDYGGSQRANWCHMVLRQLEDHPNTGFVPWTRMTQSSVGGALDDLVLGDADEIPDGYTTKRFPNLFTSDNFDCQEEAIEWIKKWLNKEAQ